MVAKVKKFSLEIGKFLCRNDGHVVQQKTRHPNNLGNRVKILRCGDRGLKAATNRTASFEQLGQGDYAASEAEQPQSDTND